MVDVLYMYAAHKINIIGTCRHAPPPLTDRVVPLQTRPPYRVVPFQTRPPPFFQGGTLADNAITKAQLYHHLRPVTVAIATLGSISCKQYMYKHSKWTFRFKQTNIWYFSPLQMMVLTKRSILHVRKNLVPLLSSIVVQ